MRRLILNLAVSLDSFIEDAHGGFDWCLTDQDYGMTDLLSRVDAIILGRKSYDLLVHLEPAPYPGKKKYVFSRTHLKLPQETEQLHDIASVRQLKASPGKDIWLYGGASLAGQLINAGLVDELQLSVHPILLGSGKPLFTGLDHRIYFVLHNTITYDSGLVQLHYHLALS